MGIKRRPERLHGEVYVIPTHFGNLTLSINESEGSPFEIIASVGIAGSDLVADASALGMAISEALRLEESGLSAFSVLRIIAEKFSPIVGNGGYLELEGKKIASLPAAIGYGIQRYFVDRSIDPGSDTLPPRPTEADGWMCVIPTHFGKMTLDIHLKDREPFEIIVNVGAAGSDLMAEAAALGIAVSVCLRTPAPMSVWDRLQWIIDRFSKMGGSNGMATSLPAAVAKGLRKFMVKFCSGEISESTYEAIDRRSGSPTLADPEIAAEAIPKNPCPECGSHALAMSEGCVTCHSCGYSKCS